MKKVFKKIAPTVFPLIAIFSPQLKNNIVRKYFNLFNPIINDLSLNRTNSYQSNSYYPTFFKKSSQLSNRLIKNYNLDSNGIPRMKYRDELHYNPVQIAQYGLLEYGFYISDNSTEKFDNALAVGEWLVNHQNLSTGGWDYNFDYYIDNINYSLKSPWNSAMAQGQSISLLCRLYENTNDLKFLKAAESAIHLLEKDVEDGGLKSYFNGIPHFEEYPTLPSSYTLNGFLFCLFGVYDLSLITKNDRTRELFNIGVEALVDILPLYDDSSITYYDLTHITFPSTGVVQNMKYHIIHIILLENLYSIYENETIKYYINKWRSI